MGGQTFAGTTPRGAQLYREVGTDRYYVRERIEGFRAAGSVRDLHHRRPIGRFETFTAAAAFVDGGGR